MDGSIHILLQDVLGEYSIKSKGNIAFFCPFCKHYKQKLEVHPERGQWNCWVCGTKGKSLYSLFKRLQVSNGHFERLFTLQPKTIKYKDLYVEEQTQSINLPKEYIPLWIEKPKSFFYKTARSYLESRNITYNDILKYRLGYCEGGIYDGMIIIPNYNKSGKLTYFTNRSFLAANRMKFINPPIERNMIGFEMQLNWDEPLTIVEAALDAIVIRNNAVPLYGKLIPEILKMSILENEVKDINICLDADALQKALDHSEYFISNGINVNLVKLPIGMDPSKLGYQKTWDLINNAKRLSEGDVFSYKIKRKI